MRVHFTTGTQGWPTPSGGGTHGPRTLGFGGAVRGVQEPTIEGGSACIDRAAHRPQDSLRTTVLHELLHAWGIIAHVDPAQYPASVLQPINTPTVDAGLATTLDGEALRALARLPVGKRVQDLTVADFGRWETTGFHLLGTAPLGGANTAALQWGVGGRNGLPTPWVYGPQPDRTLAHLGSTATWTGTLLGLTRGPQGRTVRGDAALRINFDRSNGRAAFTRLESWAPRTHPGTPGTGTQWGDGDLAYTLTLWEDGTTHRSGFDSAFAAGDDPGVVTGVFVGTAHEGAAGVLEHPGLAAAFGGLRE